MNRDLQTRAMYLFERVGEPLFLGPRGGSSNVLYEIPNLSPNQQHASVAVRTGYSSGVSSRIGGGSGSSASTSTMVSLSTVQIPDLSNVGQLCPKSSLFSYFLPNHRQAANEVRQILMNEQNVENFISLASACRDSIMVNTDLWVYAFASACLNRRDMRGFRMPALFEVLPGSFFNPQVLRQAQEQSAVPGEDRMVIEIPRWFTAETNNPEAPLAYYREDLGINSHHWHWHLIYTGQAPKTGPGSRNRKGELFYHMHHSMLARYDAERLCNGLPSTVPLDVTARLDEGYFPKLTNSNSGRIWNGRQENTTLSMVGRDFQVGPNDIRQWSDRIAEAIDSGVIITGDNQRLPLTEESGIDLLGDVIENGGVSAPNARFYGNLHNMGHVLIGLSHDPENRHLEGFGVMGDTATAMRDPAFYRWHKYIDDIFTRYKSSLQPYTQQQLVWEGIQVTGVSVQAPNVGPNILVTHWTQSDIDLSRGMDFGRTAATGGAVWARITHLNHERFTYQINVTSNATQQVSGTVRIFLAPRNNQRGERLSFRDQRLLFFEMDRFSTNLQPGNNAITRNSQDSTLTIPWNETFRDLEGLAQNANQIAASQAVCGCGWPEHLLLPRGSTAGCAFDIFVMVTNGAEDAVARNSNQSEAQRQGCKDAFVYCGILDELYPDRKPMGFPFDRNATVPNTSTPIATLEQFIPANSNMATTQVIIRHSDRVTLRGNGAPPNMGRIDANGNVITTPAPTPSNSTGRPGTGQRPGSGQGGQRPGSGQGGQRPGSGQGGQRPGPGQGSQSGQRPGQGQNRPSRPQGSNQPIVFGDETPPPRGSRRGRDFDSGRTSPDYFDE